MEEVKQNIAFDTLNFPKAGEFVNACLSGKYRVICYGGAVRGGKTFSSLGALMLLHKIYPMSRSAVVRDTQDNLTRNVLPTLDKLLPPTFVKKVNQSAPQKWLFKNNSFMQFFAESYDSDKEGKRWNGFELNFILLEQAEELEQMTFEKALERLGSYVMPEGYKQPPPLLLITVNPNKGWVKQMIYDRWKNGTLPENWLYIPAKITDNPYIPESYLESLQELKLTNHVKYERFVNGDWEIEEPTGVEFYSSFNRSIHVGKYPFVPGHNIVHLTYDFNSLPYMTQIGIQAIRDEARGKTQIRVFKEWCLRPPNNKAASVTKAFADEFRGQNISVFYYGDASGKSRIPGKGDERAFDDIEEGLLHAGFLHNNSDRVAKRNMNVLKRRDFINALLEGYKWPDIEIRIDESCTETIQDFEKVKQDMYGKVKERQKDKLLGISYEKYGHCFVAGTKVQTNKGAINIEDVKPGDRVLTRKGYRNVLRHLDQGIKKVETYRIGETEVTCTPDHKFYTKEYDFTEVQALIEPTTFCIFDNINNQICEKKLSITKVLTSTDTPNQSAIHSGTTIQEELSRTEKAKRRGCTAGYGLQKSVRYQKVTTFTTKTRTRLTTIYLTLNAYQEASIYPTITTPCLKALSNTKKMYSLALMTLQKNGTDQKRGGNGTRNMQNVLHMAKKERLCASNVTNQLAQQSKTAARYIAQESVKNDSTICGTEKWQRVYDLTVDGEHEFFANGILVHNCSDATDYFFTEFFDYLLT